MAEHPDEQAAARGEGGVSQRIEGGRDRRRDTPESVLIRPRGTPSGPGRASRRTLAMVAVVLIGAWLVLVFGGALGRVNSVQDQAATARAENEVLRHRLAAGRAEVALIQTEAFLLTQARAYGMGEANERPFALEIGAPDPRPIVPLGADPEPPAPPTPLDEWLDLIFG